MTLQDYDVAVVFKDGGALLRMQLTRMHLSYCLNSWQHQAASFPRMMMMRDVPLTVSDEIWHFWPNSTTTYAKVTFYRPITPYQKTSARRRRRILLSYGKLLFPGAGPGRFAALDTLTNKNDRIVKMQK